MYKLLFTETCRVVKVYEKQGEASPTQHVHYKVY